MKGKMNFNLDMLNFVLLVVILIFLVVIMVRQSKEDFMGPLALGYSPLPCKADGSTDWNSKLQVGHETCVEYGSDGSETGARKKQDFSNKLLVIKSWKLILGALKRRQELLVAAQNKGVPADASKLSAINGDINDFIDEYDELLESDSVKNDDETKDLKPLNVSNDDLNDQQLNTLYANNFGNGEKQEPDGLK